LPCSARRSRWAPASSWRRISAARRGAQALAVAGVTVANGGDNLGAYIPLFASAPAAVLGYAAIFAVLTGVWCALGHWLATHRALSGPIRRYGPVALPLVLIGLGLHILAGAAALLDR